MVNKKVLVSTPEALEVLNSFDKTLPVFSDTETDGLYGYVRTLQVYQPQTSDIAYILDFDECDYDAIIPIFKELWTVWHNASYDCGTMNFTTKKVDDTLWLCKLAFPSWKAFGLDNAIVHIGYESLYDGLDKKNIQKSGFVEGAYLSQTQLNYAATDVIALSKLWEVPQIQAARDVLAYKIDILSLHYAVKYQQNGIQVDQQAVEKELLSLVDDIKANEHILGDVNCNSPKQVCAALGSESSNKATLVKLIGAGNELAEAVYNQRRLLKRRTMLESYNHPKVFTKYNVNCTTTGRFTCSGKGIECGINAQQIPRDLQYIMNANTEDTVVVHADYSTAELRAGCSIMGDSAMYKQLVDGIDLHRIAATLALADKLPEDITKDERQTGKAISFGFIFGMSAPSFVDYAYVNFGIVFTEAQARKIKSAYQTQYPDIAKYAAFWWNNYKTKYVTTPQGHKAKAKLGTDAINYATQGCVGETMKLAVHYLAKETNNESLEYTYNIVHDAMYLRVPRGSQEFWAEAITSSMIKAWKETSKLSMLKFKDIPMPVEVEYVCPETNKHIVKEYS